MPTEMLTKDEHRISRARAATAVSTEREELGAAARRRMKQVRRLKINVVAWALGGTLLTIVWVLNQWQANGAFESFGHEGDAGQWNPTLWALGVGLWGLVVGIMSLRVYVRRPTTEAEVDRALERVRPHGTTKGAPTRADLRRFARVRLDRSRRLKFHIAAWVLGMIVLTPLWALIEWQDNGGFERWSSDSQPGEWEPWILYIGGIWALVIAALALKAFLERPATEAEIDRELERLRSGR